MANVWQNRIVGHGLVSPSDLLANPKNWRIHPEAQREALEGALNEVGFVRSVTVNKTTGFVVDGHLRVATAISRDQSEIPVEYVELSEEEEAKVLASFDVIGSMAETDRDQVEALLSEVSIQEDGLAKALEELKRSAGIRDILEVDAPPEVDRADELEKEWGTERGQIWECGESRIACGDATSGHDVERLLDGNAPAVMVTDPPYGVEYSPNWRNEEAKKGNLTFAARRIRKIHSDDRADWSEAWALFPGIVFYCWHGGLHAATVQVSIEGAGFEVRNQIIWSKPHFPISRGHYTWRHEPCWYSVRKGKSAQWIGDSRQSTVWGDIPLDRNVDGGHSTQKPVECMERAIRNHEGDVYDPFVGTGTTLIAAFRQRRICYGMDIDPGCVAVTLSRFKNATGIHPTLSTL